MYANIEQHSRAQAQSCWAYGSRRDRMNKEMGASINNGLWTLRSDRILRHAHFDGRTFSTWNAIIALKLNEMSDEQMNGGSKIVRELLFFFFYSYECLPRDHSIVFDFNIFPSIRLLQLQFLHVALTERQISNTRVYIFNNICEWWISSSSSSRRAPNDWNNGHNSNGAHT